MGIPEQPSGVIRLAQDYFHYVAVMEHNGFYCNINDLRATEADAEEEELRLLTAIALITPSEFKPTPKQLLTLLRDRGLTLESTNVHALNEVAGDSELVRLVLDLRGVQKLLGTNCAGYRGAMDEQGLIHSSYGVEATETGRLSSSRPNCQNIPPACRHWFQSRHKGGLILSTDLSSLEYRLVAHLSRSEKLIRLFNNNEDLHDDTAREVFNISGDVSKGMRKRAKTINYGSVYGVGKKKFLAMIGQGQQSQDSWGENSPTPAQGNALYRKTKGLFPMVNRWKERLTRNLHQTKLVSTPTGRLRYFDEEITNSVEREAFNWRLQSFGHDIMMVYLMEVMDTIESEGIPALLVQENHDSLLLDIQPEGADDALAVVSSIGEDLVPLVERCFGERLTVPLYADAELMEHWT